MTGSRDSIWTVVSKREEEASRPSDHGGHVRRAVEDGCMTVFYCGRHDWMWHVLTNVYKSRVKWMVVGEWKRESDVRRVGPSS